MFGEHRPRARNRDVLCSVAAALFSGAAAAQSLDIPVAAPDSKRLIELSDVSGLRHVGALNLSPDGRRYALLVFQGDAASDSYRSAWFVGDIDEASLTRAGDGGLLDLGVAPTGHLTGALNTSDAKWSPDGKWIAYKKKDEDGVQLWRSRADGRREEKLTRHEGDVVRFAWREGGGALYYTAQPARATIKAEAADRAARGYRFDTDFWSFTDLLSPRLVKPVTEAPDLHVVDVKSRKSLKGGEADRAAFARLFAGAEMSLPPELVSDAALPPVVHRDGGSAWTVREKTYSRFSRLAARPIGSSETLTCGREQCSGAIDNIWWSDNGQTIFFQRGEGINFTERAFYAWTPAANSVSEIVRLRDDAISKCVKAARENLVCVRENASRPQHLIALDLGSGDIREIADINPEFRGVRLGEVERFEWATPEFDWSSPGAPLAGLYPDRSYGYILYPPDFDPAKKYPVFLDPYVAEGFEPLGREHALHVYAANDIIVLRAAFPQDIDRIARAGAAGMKHLYSTELNFPHMSMLMGSMLRALDEVAARGFIDLRRVGVGGVSHGAFIPLYAVQHEDRFAAVSVSSPNWGPFQFYATTNRARAMLKPYYDLSNDDWAPRPEGEGREVWRKLDLADNVEQIEAPILMHLAAAESFAMLRLIRHMADAGLPYDAYVFAEETHIKWRPAHLAHILDRNLDWFRFWLQDREDQTDAKADRYRRWRELRNLQCANPRGLRDYCKDDLSP